MRYVSAGIVMMCLLGSSWIHAQQVSAGQLDIISHLKTALGHQQDVYVWTPAGYDASIPCNVIYMLDGQMLFDANTTWNHQEWTMDETIHTLMEEHIIGPTIVVGISFADSLRHSQYTPEKPFRRMSQMQQGQALTTKRSNGQLYYLKPEVCSDDFARFLVDTLKPFVDSNYTTYQDAAHTMIGGASMGALMAMYTLLEYPQVYGSAFCMSTNWPLTEASQDPGFLAAWQAYTLTRLSLLDQHFIYMDHGGLTKDATYGPYQQSMDVFFRKNGFNRFESKYFEAHDHSETSWSLRIREVLIRIFLQQ